MRVEHHREETRRRGDDYIEERHRQKTTLEPNIGTVRPASNKAPQQPIQILLYTNKWRPEANYKGKIAGNRNELNNEGNVYHRCTKMTLTRGARGEGVVT